tara:strand:+ start:67 stop:1482 length:1416 start_codon:yes stop_codon:yes gene_type:complete
MKKFGKFFSYSLIITSIFLLIYITYRSQITYEGLNNHYYNKYYYIITSVIILSFINLKIKESISSKISAICVSIILAFYSFEITKYFVDTSTQLKTSNLKKKYAEKRKLYPEYDIRSRLEVYLDEKKKEEDVAVLPVPMSLVSKNTKKLIPLSGHSKIKTVFCNELGFYVIYKSDRYGFRNPDEQWDKEEIEYLIVGDSLGHGMCVNEQDTISGWLRNNIKNNEKNGVLNLSMWGNGPLIMYATLREYLNLKKVKRVLWLHSQGNDFTDITFEEKSEIMKSYLHDKSYSQNLSIRQNEINEFVLRLIDDRQIDGQEPDMYNKNISFEDIKQIIKLTRLRKLTLDQNFFDQYKQPLTENLGSYKKILIQAKELSEKNNTKFYFVDLPDIWARKYSEQDNLLWNEKVIATNEIKSFLKKNEIPYIDIYKKVFENHEDVLSLFPFRGFGHFNQKGYTSTAKSIHDEVMFLESKF